MVNSHERPDKVKLREELVDRHSDRFKRVHSVVVLDQLIVRSAQPGEAEQVAKRWIHEHGKDVSRNFVHGRYGAVRGRLQHLAERADNVLVDQVPIQILRANRHYAGLADEGAQALERRQMDDLQVRLAEELDENGHDSALEERVYARNFREEYLAELRDDMKQLFDKILNVS